MTQLTTSMVSDLGLAQAALTTLAAALTIGFAFLLRPGPATLLWTIGFSLAMLASCGAAAAGDNDLEAIRRACLGALMGAPAFLWSGFRALWGLPTIAWAGVAVTVVWTPVLAFSGDSGWFPDFYRGAFFTASLFAGMLFVDWLRTPRARGDRVMLPLAIMSPAFFVLALVAFVAGFLPVDPAADEFSVLRPVASVGMILYVAAVLFAVLGIVARDTGLLGRPARAAERQRFERAASERLLRAQTTGEPWSVVHFRLDDATDIRLTAGVGAISKLSARFTEDIRSALPADADVASPSLGTVVAVLPHPDATVRTLVRTALDRVRDLDVHRSVPIRPTASAGWAPTSVLGYDFDALAYTAREAAMLAAQNGGDRWERVGAAVVERLFSETVPR